MSKKDLSQVEEASTTPEEEDKEPAKTNLMACIGYCPALFFVPLLFSTKDDEVAQNSVVQGLNLLVLFIVVKVLDAVLGLFFGYPASTVVDNVILVAQLLLVAATAVGMVRAYSDKIFKLPIIGSLDLIKKIKGE